MWWSFVSWGVALALLRGHYEHEGAAGGMESP